MIRPQRLSLAWCCVLLPTFASATEIAGVKVPETVQVGAKTLKLNGAGLRTKYFFKAKVYVAGLHLETQSKDAATVIASQQLKRVELTFLRDLDREQVTDAIGAGFERNSGAQMQALKARLDKLKSFITDVAERDQLQITYVPGKGTTITVKGKEKGVLEGKDFADALFSVWLGSDPVDEGLKTALLGR